MLVIKVLPRWVSYRQIFVGSWQCITYHTAYDIGRFGMGQTLRHLSINIGTCHQTYWGSRSINEFSWHFCGNNSQITLLKLMTSIVLITWNKSPGQPENSRASCIKKCTNMKLPVTQESIRPRKLPLSSTLASPELLVSRQTVWNPSFRHKTHRTLCDMWWHLRFKSFSALLLESASDWKASYREWRGNWPWSQMIIW